MIRYYLVNVVAAVRGGVEVPNSQTAEYFGVPQAGVEAAYMSFGNEGTMLVCADTDAATHAAFAALPRVIQLPEDLDQKLTGVATLRTALEARNIPAHWLTTSITYRQALRGLIGISQFAQVYHAQTRRRLFQDSVRLTTRMNQIPLAERNRLSEVAALTGLDTSGVTGTTTVRQLLKLLGDQWLQRPTPLGRGVI